MTIAFSDNFTGISGTAINGRAGTGGTGSWTCFGVGVNDIAGLKINASNQARIATTNGCLGRVEAGSADHYVKAALWVATAAGAVAARATDHLNFLGLRANSLTQIELFKRVGGTETTVVKLTVATLGLPFTLELRCAGTQAYIFLNGVQQGAAGGYAIDPVFAGLTKTGLWGKSSTADPLADDFEGGTLVATLAAAGGRSASRGGTPALGEQLALAPGRGLSAARGGGAAVSLALALAPASARGASRSGIAAVGWNGALVSAGGRSAGRGGAAMLSGTGGLMPGAGRSAMRAGTAALTLPFAVTPARGRSAMRAGAAGVAVFHAGFVTGVSAEMRTVPVARG